MMNAVTSWLERWRMLRTSGFFRAFAVYYGSLIFLVFAFEPHRAVGQNLLLVVGCLCLGFSYSACPVAAQGTVREHIICLAGIVCGIGLIAIVNGWSHTILYLFYFQIGAAAMLALWPAVVTVVVGSVVMFVSGLGLWNQPNQTAVILASVGCISGISMTFGIERGRRQSALHRERERNAVLAVSAERERIARDLHDILGHSLTAISVSAELAARLVDVNPAEAQAQMSQVAHVARQSLADVRATVTAMKQVRLAGELATARSVLNAAGITITAPSALPALDDSTSELLGYGLREAVTNIVRHSGATKVSVDVDGQRLVVRDDGRGISGDLGNGLTGLTRRFSDAGWALIISSTSAGTQLIAAKNSLTDGEMAASKETP